MIVCSALMIWKSLMIVTGSESPVVVVLRYACLDFIRCWCQASGSMEPAYHRGDLLLLTMTNEPYRVGDVVVFKLDHRPIPIVHRILTVHEEWGGSIPQLVSDRHDSGDLEVDMLTKGDSNPVNDRGLYERGDYWARNVMLCHWHLCRSYVDTQKTHHWKSHRVSRYTYAIIFDDHHQITSSCVTSRNMMFVSSRLCLRWVTPSVKGTILHTRMSILKIYIDSYHNSAWWP